MSGERETQERSGSEPDHGADPKTGQVRPGGEPERVGVLAWRTIAEVVLRVHEDLDRAWELPDLARVAGYEATHFSHLFAEVVGEPPLRYVRRLRLERAAHELVGDPDLAIATAATRAGYGSLEAFSRSFRRTFGVSPREFRATAEERVGSSPIAPRRLGAPPASESLPAGVRGAPAIERVGPLFGWTIVVPTFEMQDVGPAMFELLSRKPPDAPYQIGGIAQPWGWLTGGARDLRVLRIVGANQPAPPPLLPWRLPRGWFAVFDYEGPPDAIASAIQYILSKWIPSSGLRFAYAPLFTLLEGLLEPDKTPTRIHVPIEPLDVGGEA